MKRNILLLAMSTLRAKAPDPGSFYNLKQELLVDDCIGQLEPIPKYMITRYGSAEPLEIIIFCTDDAENDRNNFSGMAAVEYFEERIREYCRENGFQETNLLFRRIGIDEDRPVKGIHEAVNYIRSIKRENNLGKFWIDTHGGFREVTLVMESIVSLLKVDIIIPDRILGVRYGDSSNNYIVDQIDSFEMFDFVAGMNEFINYGSVGILKKYYDNKNKTEIEENVLNAMEMVAEGAEESDPQKYTQGLDILGEEIDKIGGEDGDLLLSMFRDYVKDSYGPILNKNTRTTIGIISRCMEKDLVQQALTFIETMMPKDIVDHGLIEYDPNLLEQKRKEIEKKGKRIATWKEGKNFLVDAYVSNNYLNPYIKAWRFDKKDYSEIDYFEWMKNSDEEAEYCFIRTDNGSFIKLDSKDDTTKIDITTRIKEWGDRQKAGELMSLHKALKECRNKYVHCNSNRADKEDIKKAIQRYIELAKDLFNRYQIPKERR